MTAPPVIQSKRSRLLERTEDERFPDCLRVNAAKVEVTPDPHQWQSVRMDEGKVGRAMAKLRVRRWRCTKCGGWVDIVGKPSPHMTPVCNQMVVNQVHER